MLNVNIVFTFIHDISYYFSCVGLSFFFYLFASDVVCIELSDCWKLNRFNLSPSFSLKFGWGYVAMFEWTMTYFIKMDQSFPFI